MSAERIHRGLRMPLTRAAAVLVAAVCACAGLVSGPSAVAAPAAGPTGPTQVAIVFPLTVPEARIGLLSAATLAAHTAPGGLLTRELDAVIGTPVAIGIDPLVIASIRLLGSSAPESAVDWLSQLNAADNDTFALSWADSDITAPLQAGSATVLAPTSLDFAIDPERFGPEPLDPEGSETSAPDGAVDPGLPPLPTTDGLLDWDHSLDEVAWPIAGTVVSSDLAAIAASGFGTTLLGSGNVRRANDGLAAASVSDSSVVVTDDELSGMLAVTSAATTIATWQESLTRLEAALDASGATTAVLAVDRNTIGGGTRLRSTIASLDAVDGLAVTTLPDVIAAGTTTGELVDSPQDPERVALTATALQAEAADASFAMIAADPARIIADRRLELLSALSPSWSRHPTGWAGALGGFVSSSTELRDSVHVIGSSDIVFPDRGYLPFTVNNDLDQPVTVHVVVRPLSPLLDVEDDWFEITIEPNSQRRALIPAVARSNGLVNLAVSLTSAAREPIGSPVYVTANVQAGWETPLTIGFAVVVVLVFAGGVYRTVMRRRKSAAAPGERDTE